MSLVKIRQVTLLILSFIISYFHLNSAVAEVNLDGVDDSAIVVGYISDLTGPISMLGVPVGNAMKMRFDEINQQGGVYGRKINLLVEDGAYDPGKALLGVRKMINSGNGVFAFLATMGTPVVMATMPVIVEAGDFHLFPFSPHQSTYLPTHPLKFQIFAPYQDYMDAGVREMLRRGEYKKTCLLWQDDEYGEEVRKGVITGLQKKDSSLHAETSYKRGATDFSAQIVRLKEKSCDFLVLATVVRETIAVLHEMQRQAWSVPVLVSASGYDDQVPELAGKAGEGLYAISVLPHPYQEGANEMLVAWIEKYQNRFGMTPNVWSVMGYTIADLFVKALEITGPDVTREKFTQALESLRTEHDFFDSPVYAFSAQDHLGNRKGRLAQVRNGRWQILSNYLD